MFGSPETTPGGRALKFYSSVRLDVRKIENLKDGTEVVGSRTRVKVVKNKVAPPFRQCEFDIMYGKGISKEGSLIDVGVDLEIIKKSGAWFTYEGEQLGQGRENARAFLAEHVDIRDEIERKVREAVGLNGVRRRGRREPIEIVPDAVLEDDAPRDRADDRKTAGKAQGQERRQASDATGGFVASGAPGSEEPQELPRACARAPGGASTQPPGARAPAPPGRVRARGGRRRARRLERVGLIDDEAFARQVAEHAFASRRRGRRAVAGALLQKGVDRGPHRPGAGRTWRARRSGPSSWPHPRPLACGSLEPSRPSSGSRGILVRRGYGPEVARGAARKALEVEADE